MLAAAALAACCPELMSGDRASLGGSPVHVFRLP